MKINSQKMSMLCFADNIALIADNEKDLEKLIKTVNETLNKDLNIRINMQKIKVLICGK